MRDNTTDVFFALLRVGLWEGENLNHDLDIDGTTDWGEVYRLAKQQSVVGLIAAGVEIQSRKTKRIPHEMALKMARGMLKLEQRNIAMNRLIADLVNKMRVADIETLLVKGQGIAQCYERPLWRASGDVDFYLSDANFEKAKAFFRPLVESFDPDDDYARHINMHYKKWVLEIHANQYCSLSGRVNRVMDEIHQDLFNKGNVRSWDNDGTTVLLPAPDDDVLIVFVHFMNHFYKGGLGVRQICDWCRLLWTYRDSLNRGLLESRLSKAGLISVWKGFAAFAVEYLGMPAEAMPLLDIRDKKEDIRWKKKADRICSFIMEVGDFGHNRDTSYYKKYPRLVRKVVSFGRRCGDMWRHAKIFPMDSLKFFPYMLFKGLRSAAIGE
jgi:hypothetical protein